MLTHLGFFFVGLVPQFFFNLALSLGGQERGLALAGVFLLLVALLIGVLLFVTLPILRRLIPQGHRRNPMLSLALGLSLGLVSLLPRLLPESLERTFYLHFLWCVAFLFCAFTLSFSVLGRLVVHLRQPKRPRSWALALMGLFLVSSVGAEYLQSAPGASPTTPGASRSDTPGALQAVEAVEAEWKERPNVLLLVLDTLRFDTHHQEWMGQKHFPRLDELTRGGTHFIRSYAGCNFTPGGHTTLFTGRYPSETETLARGLVTLDDSYFTLAEFLQAHGYRTGAIVSNPRVSARFGYAQGFEVYDDSLVNPKVYFSAVGARLSETSLIKILGSPYSQKLVRGAFRQGMWTDELVTAGHTTEHAFEVVDGMGIGEDPWFLFLNYIDPHSPFITAQQYADSFGPGYESDLLQPSRGNIAKIHLALKRLQRRIQGGETRAEDLRWLQEAYREQCLELDQGVADFLVGLQERGLWDENTLVVITSDHGEHLGEHNEIMHGSTLLDPEVRVPLIVLGPGFEAGQVHRPVTGGDLFVSVCYAMGLDPDRFPETSGFPLQLDAGDRVIQFEHGELRGFLAGSHKMIAVDDGSRLEWVEAYDLQQDPGELHNLIDAGLPWVEAFRVNPPIQPNEQADVILSGDDEIDLAALGYADEVIH